MLQREGDRYVCMLVTSALKRLRQKDHNEFKTSMRCTVSSKTVCTSPGLYLKMMGDKKQKLRIGKSNVTVLVSVSIVVIKQYDHKQHGKVKVYFAYNITAHH